MRRMSHGGPEKTSPEPFSPMRWEGPGLKLLDQTRLPVEEVWIDCETPEQVADAIRRLAVRGAPAIGVAAAYGLVLGLRTVRDPGRLRERFEEVSNLLGSTQPDAGKVGSIFRSSPLRCGEHSSAHC